MDGWVKTPTLVGASMNEEHVRLWAIRLIFGVGTGLGN
jgi:hypothetical protein